MEHNKTFAMIKPGAVHRMLIGNIINRFEQKGLKIIAMKMIWVTQEQAAEHYATHKNKDFYQDLINYITSSPVVALSLEGENAVELVRNMAGNTSPLKAAPGTIRGDLCSDIENNIIHTADSVDSAKHELSIYFKEEEYLDYEKATEKWSFEFSK